MRLLITVFIISISFFGHFNHGLGHWQEPRVICKDSLPVNISNFDPDEKLRLPLIKKGDIGNYIKPIKSKVGLEYYIFKSLCLNDSIFIYFIFNENEDMFERKIYLTTVNRRTMKPVSMVLFYLNSHDADFRKGQLSDLKGFQVKKIQEIPYSEVTWEGDEQIRSKKVSTDYYSLFPNGKIKLISTSDPLVKKFAMDSLGELIER